MKDKGQQREKDLKRRRPLSQQERDQLSAETTERWFFNPNQREHPEFAYERRCQERSLHEFS